MGEAGRSTQRRSCSRSRSGSAEALLVLTCAAIFAFLHGTAGKDVAAATANADAVQSLERTLHLNVEKAANAWLADRMPLIHVAVFVYRSYYLAVIGVLVWVFLRHREHYLKVRRTLVAMIFLIVPVYWAYPLSPPRFAMPGVTDVVAEHDLSGTPRGLLARARTTTRPARRRRKRSAGGGVRRHRVTVRAIEPGASPGTGTA